MPFARSNPCRIEAVELDAPGPGEVLVEIRAAGLCHSDLSVVEGLRKRPLPVVGDHDGGLLNHYSGISVFAQYAVVAPQSLVKIDRAVPIDAAAMFGCAIVTGAGAVFNSAKVQPGESVAVIGLGGVGLTAVMAAREAGAAPIIGLDVLPSKFDLAHTVGATHCIDAREPQAVQQVLDLTNGGATHVFEISGALAALDTAEAIAAPGGEIVCVGVGKSDAAFPVRQFRIVTTERVIRGSFMGGGFDQLHRGAVVRQILLPHGV